MTVIISLLSKNESRLIFIMCFLNINEHQIIEIDIQNKIER
jgi:hypothetical protein